MKKVLIIFIGVIILTASILFYYNYQFWTHFRTDNFEALIEYNGKNISGFRGRQILIHKNFESYIKKIDEYATNNNVKLIINQSYRSDKQTLSQTVVKPGKRSNHLAGFAIDFNIKSDGIKYFSGDLKSQSINGLPKDIQGFINDIRENKNLRWGGDFRKEDPVHIDHPINLKNKSQWAIFTKNCATDYTNRIPKWKIWKQ